MGNNTNLVDYCYVGNVADAHILAADRLAALASSPPSTAEPIHSFRSLITRGRFAVFFPLSDVGAFEHPLLRISVVFYTTLQAIGCSGVRRKDA